MPPGANEAEPGVFKSIHGMVRLVDLRVRFGVDKSDYATPGRIVVVEVEGGHAGFWVDEIEDVIGFPEAGWAQVPAYIPRNVFSRTWIKDKRIRLFADFDKLDKFKSVEPELLMTAICYCAKGRKRPVNPRLIFALF